MADATGEAKQPPLRVGFDHRIKLDFHGARITSDGGLLAYRELDDALGLTALGASGLTEDRGGKNIQHRLLGLLRQAVYGRLAGYEDVNDAARLAHDPAMRATVGRERIDRPAASTSEMGRFETEVAGHRGQPGCPHGSLRRGDRPGARAQAAGRDHPRPGQLGEPDLRRQEGSAYNGHFRCTCYHPVVPLQPVRRPGALPPAPRQRPRRGRLAHGPGAGDRPLPRRGLALYFRADAAFAKPEIYELLEAEDIDYAIRLPTNRVLQERIAHLLTRPVGGPPKEPQVFFASFSYQAQSWTKARRVGAKVEWHQSELYPRVGFVVTNLKRPAERVVRFHHGRGTAEQHIRRARMRSAGRGCPAMPSATTWCGSKLHALAYNLANFLRTLALPQEVEHWSLTTLREKLVKIGARIVSHGRYVVYQLAEVAVPRALFADILRRIDGLRPQTPPLPAGGSGVMNDDNPTDDVRP